MTPNYREMLRLISDETRTDAADFTAQSKALADFAFALSKESLLSLLDYCGTIPEAYSHDSSEEKLYAKAMDCVTAAAMRMLDYDASVYVERSNKADVLARWGGDHSVAMDAKAFRLSRTAKNPKDYKIEALNGWRRADEATFACLVAPATGFLLGRSRLYAEAVSYNVALISFTHLKFAIEHKRKLTEGLAPLFDIQRYATKTSAGQPNAADFWRATDEAFCQLMKRSMEEWSGYRRSNATALISIADAELERLRNQKSDVGGMSKQKLESLAISLLRIDERAARITSGKEAAADLLRQIEEAEN